MAKTREQEERDLVRLVDALDSAKLAVLTDYRGLDVPASEELRGLLRDKGITFVVTKNTLLKRAAEKSAKEITETEAFTGPMAVAF